MTTPVYQAIARPFGVSSSTARLLSNHGPCTSATGTAGPARAPSGPPRCPSARRARRTGSRSRSACSAAAGCGSASTPPARSGSAVRYGAGPARPRRPRRPRRRPRRPVALRTTAPAAADLVHLRDVGVVHVPGQERHRLRGGPALAVRHRQRHLRDLREAVLERRPVLEVHDLPDVLADPGPEPAPGAVDHRLVPRLEVVQARREQERQRRADEQVPEPALHLLVEPGHLGVVEDRPVPRGQHPRRAGVDHHEPDVVEVAGVAPPVGLRVLVDPLGELVERLGDVELVGRRPRRRSAATARPARARPGRGSRGAGRPSTSRAPRRSARATRRWPPSSPATTGRCSSRPGCRGRRRSSGSAAWTAATGSPGRSRPACRGGRTPRSP